MRLSDAIEMGRMMGKSKAGDWNSCALGVAGNAVGLVKGYKHHLMGQLIDTTRQRTNAIYGYWPWLVEFKGNNEYSSFSYLIIKTFDYIVCGESGYPYPEKFDNLVAWIRSIEPSCGECNRFQCTCTPTATEALIPEELIGVA